MGCVTANQGHVLVVDDDAGFRNVCSAVIDDLMPGVSVVTAADAWKARWERDRLRGPLLVISDQRMPGEQGIELLESLAQDRRPGERFVLISSFLEPDVNERAAASGIDAQFSKPGDLETLESMLGTVLERWRREVRAENIHV